MIDSALIILNTVSSSVFKEGIQVYSKGRMNHYNVRNNRVARFPISLGEVNASKETGYYHILLVKEVA